MPNSVNDLIVKEVEKLKLEIQSAIDASGKNASKRTRNSLEVRPTANGAQLWGANYIGVLETGRKDGKIPYNFGEIIQKWAQAKGISFENNIQAKRWANGVAWKIAKEGTKQFRDGKRDDILTKPIDDFTDRVANKLLLEIQNTIFEK